MVYNIRNICRWSMTHATTWNIKLAKLSMLNEVNTINLNNHSIKDSINIK